MNSEPMTESMGQSSSTETKRPRPRGFAAMDPAKVSEIARKGGKAAHAAGTAHEFSPDEARIAGKKGGLAPHSRRGTQKPEGEQSASAATDSAANLTS